MDERETKSYSEYNEIQEWIREINNWLFWERFSLSNRVFKSNEFSAV
jgi:hypothetical protein